MNYYNEIDPAAAAWLRQLIALGLVPDGEVDERSIVDVTPNDLRGYAQCHFFAGVAGWPLALERAGIPPDTPLWTGSCPCQSFSCAGKRKGFQDARDLWPEFNRLIRECRPLRVIGEQVASAVKFGWLDRLHSDLEAQGYAVGAVVLGAHSAGADHIRQRLFWVADAPRLQVLCRDRGDVEPQARGRSGGVHAADHAGRDGAVAESPRVRRRSSSDGQGQVRPGQVREDGGLAHAAGHGPSAADGLRPPPPASVEAGPHGQRQSPRGGHALLVAHAPMRGHQCQPCSRPTGLLPTRALQGGKRLEPGAHGTGPRPDGWLAHAAGHQPSRTRCVPEAGGANLADDGAGGALDDALLGGRRGRHHALASRSAQGAALPPARPEPACVVGDSGGTRPQGQPRPAHGAGSPGSAPSSGAQPAVIVADALCERRRGGQPRRVGAADAGESGQACNFWSGAVPHLCLDGKARRFEPGVFPLVDVVPRRVGRGRPAGGPLDASPPPGEAWEAAGRGAGVGVAAGGDSPPVTPAYADSTGEARVMRLKGYGNAICIETAMHFLGALDWP